MTSYQKIATLLLRLTATVWTVIVALGWSLYGVEMAVGMEVQHYPMHSIFSSIAFIVLGLVAIVFSKPLGRLIGRGLAE